MAENGSRETTRAKSGASDQRRGGWTGVDAVPIGGRLGDGWGGARGELRRGVCGMKDQFLRIHSIIHSFNHSFNLLTAFEYRTCLK